MRCDKLKLIANARKRLKSLSKRSLWNSILSFNSPILDLTRSSVSKYCETLCCTCCCFASETNFTKISLLLEIKAHFSAEIKATHPSIRHSCSPCVPPFLSISQPFRQLPCSAISSTGSRLVISSYEINMSPPRDINVEQLAWRVCVLRGGLGFGVWCGTHVDSIALTYEPLLTNRGVELLLPL